MPARRVSLDGKWEITGRDPTGKERPLSLRGRVPGQVHVDLMAQGLIPDPFWRDQAEQCQWVETWDWCYRRSFIIPENALTGWDVLQFDGLDTFATISLNGDRLGQTDNMFVPHWFEAGPYLRLGHNHIEVLFQAPARALADKPMGRYSSCFANDRVYARKMQCSYGWDWVHRFVSAGIWRSVRLVSFEHARVDDLFIHTKSLEQEGAIVQVEYTVERRSDDAISATVEIRDPKGRCVWSAVNDTTGGSRKLTAHIRQPRPWWPNGMGDQPLYTCAVTLSLPDGTVIDQRRIRFGIRTVDIEEIPDKQGSTFTLLVNGRRVFAKGANWVPADPFPSRIPDAHYERLIRLAQDAHMNMLRAWGGGIYEPAVFWDACDRMGIMVTQDFLLACAEYPEEDPDFLKGLRKEFRQAIKLLRNHPSLVWWSGNNELGMNADPDSPFPGKKLAQEVSGSLCRVLDPSRPFLPTSPFGGVPNNSPDAGDCHRSAWYDSEFMHSDMRRYRERIAKCSGRFVSEYAVPGAPPLRTLLKFMSAADLVDPEARMWEYHTKDNPYSGIDDLTHFRMLERTAEQLYGVTQDPQAKLRHMEYVQCEWARLTAESLRRRKFDCSGLLFWMYNDCWPASGWSAVDYYGIAKAGYYGMKRGFRPVIVVIEPRHRDLGIWVCSDLPEPTNCSLDVRFQPWSGAPAWKRKTRRRVPGNAAVQVDEVPKGQVGDDGVLVCTLACESNHDRAIYHRGMPREMALPTALLDVSQTNTGRHGTVTVATHCYARVVTLDADLDFSDNYFDLLPGEKQTISWSSPSGKFAGDVPVTCWNR